MKVNGTITRYGRVKSAIAVVILVLITVLSLVRADRIEPEDDPSRPAYGEFLDWVEVRDLFPKNGNAVVIDVETGLKFNVQRRGGTYHADVQPLTAADTEIMKNIYGGKWSWRRRAVLVIVGDRRIAGSMNGMPHGRGQIKGNNFPGHSCIHFRGSRLHLNGREDLAHSIMVCKAAGVLEDMMARISAEEVVRVFFTALDQKDPAVAAGAAHFRFSGELLDLFMTAEKIDRISLSRTIPNGGATVRINAGVLFNGGGKAEVREHDVEMVRLGSLGWRVEYDSVRPILSGAAGNVGSFAPEDAGDID